MTVKKAELHVHLEGTMTPFIAQKLAKRNQITLPEDLITENGKHYYSRDFMHFLQVYDTLAAVVKTPQDYYDITLDYLLNSSLEGCVYAELSYSPDHAERAGGIESIEHLKAIQQAVDDAEAKFDIIGRIIIIAVRHYGVEACEKAAEAIHKATVPSVVGFGLGGDEINFPPKLFKRAYDIAADAGLQCTVHAGEHAPASGMVEAMENLPITRIGHGVRVIDSPETMAMVKDRGIALEVCPSSNVFLGVNSSLEQHPFPKLLDAGLKLSLNSDDPPFFGTTIGEEYKRVQETYGYSDETMENITLMAIEDAFADEKTKAALRAKFNTKQTVSH